MSLKDFMTLKILLFTAFWWSGAYDRLKAEEENKKYVDDQLKARAAIAIALALKDKGPPACCEDPKVDIVESDQPGNPWRWDKENKKWWRWKQPVIKPIQPPPMLFQGGFGGNCGPGG